MKWLGFALKLLLVVLFIAGLLVLLCAGIAVPFETVFALLFGSVRYLLRTLPDVTIDWWNALGFLVLLVVCWVAIQDAGRRFLRHVQRGTSEGPCVVWHRSWTAALLGTVVMMFIAGISVTGVIHQAFWLVTSGESLLKNNFLRHSQVRNSLVLNGMGAMDYHDARNHLPVGGIFKDSGQALHGWQTLLLPYISPLNQQESLFSQIDLTVPWTADQHRAVFETRIPVLEAPTLTGSRLNAPGKYAPTIYSGNSQVMGVNRGLTFAEIKDGNSNTILMGEVRDRIPAWGSATNWRDPAVGLDKPQLSFGSTAEGVHFALCDGSVRFINKAIHPTVLKALATPDGGETDVEF